MAVPAYNQLYRPILEAAVQAGGEITWPQLRNELARHFSLDYSDMMERLPSGEKRFANRLRWAESELRRAGLLERASRSKAIAITQKGRQELATTAGDIDRKRVVELQVSMPELGDRDVGPATPEPNDVAPDEQMEILDEQMNNTLADDLLDSVRTVSPDRFELLMVRLLVKMGYGEGEKVGGSGDGGIDGTISQDLLGLEKIYIQAKRWQGPVGEPQIRDFSGSLHLKGASKGVFFTTSNFTADAKTAADRLSVGAGHIHLIDGGALARLMIKHDVGVVTEATYHVKKLDENYLAEQG